MRRVLAMMDLPGGLYPLNWVSTIRGEVQVTEKTDEMKFAFFNLAQALIGFRFWEMSFC